MRESIDPSFHAGTAPREAARPLIESMSSRLAIPRRVALQQSLPPFPQPPSACLKTEALATIRQRMVTCPLHNCLKLGVQSMGLSTRRRGDLCFRKR